MINSKKADEQLVVTSNTETANGHAGMDRISYLNSVSGVTVKLSSGTGSSGLRR